MKQLLFQLFFGRKTHVISFFGMRRSGNHACIDWIASGLENVVVDWQKSTEKENFIRLSQSGNTLHINEVNEMSWKAYVKIFFENWRSLRKCNAVLISFEDVLPHEVRRNFALTDFYIVRDSSEVIASRYHNINKLANQGIAWERQTLDSGFFVRLRAFNILRNGTSNPSGILWDYNAWMADSDYRRAILNRLGIDEDILPLMSQVGRGSSFGKKAVDTEDRLSLVEPRDAFLRFLVEILADPYMTSCIEESALHRISRFIEAQKSGHAF